MRPRLEILPPQQRDLWPEPHWVGPAEAARLDGCIRALPDRIPVLPLHSYDLAAD